MKQLLQIVIVGFAVNLGIAVDSTSHLEKVVCYWNSSTYLYPDNFKIKVTHLLPALHFCTHFIYGFAGINRQTFEINPLNPEFDIAANHSLYRNIIKRKKRVPNLKVYLSIGGGADTDSNYEKYLNVLDNGDCRFISSVVKLVTDYDFDGVDLAWQFPRNTDNDFKHKTERSYRKNVFTFLVQRLSARLRIEGKALTLTILPNVHREYYDLKNLASNLDAIHFMAFDRVNPEDSPQQADYPSQLYSNLEKKTLSIYDDVNLWLSPNIPKEKIIIGIPTFARTWKLTNISATGPPVPADGPGHEGHLSFTPGFLSYREVCYHIKSQTNEFVVVEDFLNNNKSYGNYAYRLYDPKTNLEGMWIAYENPISVRNKINYVIKSKLGGVAFWDLASDDISGYCTGERFPIISTVTLTNSN